MVQRCSIVDLNLALTALLIAIAAAAIAWGVLQSRRAAELAAMLAHALLNTVTLVLAPLVDDPLESARPGNPWLGLGLLLAGGLATAAVLRAIARRTTASRGFGGAARRAEPR